ncbi:hypothetical protein FACS1894190_12510 [Spirochaetia bacterium]|nr:hypothetical protein FACS1894190_12510 [Spirochaetia bacterium]
MRIEVIANNSVEENIFEAFKEEGVAKFYTKFNGAHGVGTSGPRMGDAIWPEENFVLVIWCDLKEALGIERALKKIKGQFPAEGIKLFGLHELSTSALLTGEKQRMIEYKPDELIESGALESIESMEGLPITPHPETGVPDVPDVPEEPPFHLPDGLGLNV